MRSIVPDAAGRGEHCRDRFPLWCFLVHVVTHSAEQRRDAAVLLRMAGHPPPDLEFLYFLDSLGPPAQSAVEAG